MGAPLVCSRLPWRGETSLTDWLNFYDVTECLHVQNAKTLAAHLLCGKGGFLSQLDLHHRGVVLTVTWGGRELCRQP